MADGMETQSSWQRFYQQLKDRRVFRVATLYVILFWPIIQIADILSPALGLPPEAMRNLLIVFVLGLPVALVLSWLFDLNRSGIVRTDEAVEASPPEPPLVGHSLERAVIGFLLLVIVVLFYFQFRGVSDSGRVVPAPQEAGASVRALAVLPFATFSSNPDDEFFADGLTEELLNVLSRLQNLRVTARTSTFAYKGVNKKVQDIGYELQVDTILEGSVRRNDVENTIRITAQLIDVESGGHLWSRTFDRQFRDVFKIQDEIAAAVVAQLQLTLAADEENLIQARASANPEALVVSSMGRAELAKRTRQGFADALRFFKRAVETDANYPEAHAELAQTYALMYSYGDKSSAHLDNAERAAQRAIEIDAKSAEGWAALGLIHIQRDERPEAIEALEKALVFNPSHAMAHMWLGELQTDPGERERLHRRAFELDPRSPVAGWNVANNLFLAGRDAEAVDVFDQIIEADPYYPMAYDLVAQIDESHGRLVPAVRNYEKAMELDPNARTAMRLAYLYLDIGEASEADDWIATADKLNANPSDLGWLRVSASVARDDWAAAENLMRGMLNPVQADAQQMSNAVAAAYFLEQPQQAVEHWQVLVEKYPEHTLQNLDAKHDVSLEAPLAAAYAYQQLDRRVEAAAVLDAIEAWIDQRIASPRRYSPDLWYFKALASSVRGQTSPALVYLQRAIDEGWRQHWRLAAEPCLADLRALDTYQSVRAGLSARMELIGEQLAFDGLFAGVAPQP